MISAAPGATATRATATRATATTHRPGRPGARRRGATAAVRSVPRRRERQRLEISREAIRLVDERGVAETTGEDIAAADGRPPSEDEGRARSSEAVRAATHGVLGDDAA